MHASEQLEGDELSSEEEDISKVKGLNKISKRYDEQKKNIKICSHLKGQCQGQISCLNPLKGSGSLVLFQEEQGAVKANPPYF